MAYPNRHHRPAIGEYDLRIYQRADGGARGLEALLSRTILGCSNVDGAKIAALHHSEDLPRGQVAVLLDCTGRMIWYRVGDAL